jgi:acylphosphatase
MTKAYNLKVRGIVQGVFFRKSTANKAAALGISGTVCNCADGSVEIFAEGDEENLTQFIAWCHIGPQNAKVEAVDIHEQPLKNFRGFIVTH